MTTMTMTVHEALSKLKVLNKRVYFCDNIWLATSKANDKKVNGYDVEDIKSTILSNYDKSIALIEEINAIKRAISKYNAETIITVGGKEMSVAEAIYMKDYGIEHKKDLLSALSNAYNTAQKELLARNGRELDDRAEKFVSATFGSKDKASSDEVEKAMKSFKENNMTVLIDPLKIADKISALRDEIDAFESSVDSAIQVANAIHTLDVTF